jgi:hypothetical protein
VGVGRLMPHKPPKRAQKRQFFPLKKLHFFPLKKYEALRFYATMGTCD